VREGGGKKTWVFLMVSSRLHPAVAVESGAWENRSGYLTADHSRKGSGTSQKKSRALVKGSRTGAEEVKLRTGGWVSRACGGMDASVT
jgi:hypothetical protein